MKKIFYYSLILIIVGSCKKDNVNNLQQVFAGKVNSNMDDVKFQSEFKLSYTFVCGYGDAQDSIDLFEDKKYDIIIKARFLDYTGFLACCSDNTDCLPTNLRYQLTFRNNIKAYGYNEVFQEYKFLLADTLGFNTRIDTMKTNWYDIIELWNNNYPHPHQGKWYFIEEDKFLAIRIGGSSPFKYGWIKIGSTRDHNLIFKEYALEE